MRLPDTNLPFFAYGLFKPGELCFFRIRDLVDKKRSREAGVNGALKERDGIPLLVEGNFKIEGYLIYFKNGKEKEAYKQIIEIEPKKVYYWYIIDLEKGISANVLRGKSPDKGSSDFSDLEYWTNWTGKTDPFFNEALYEVKAILDQDASVLSNDYGSLFRLQMGYMLLWSSIERYAGFRHHLRGKATEKVQHIAKEPCFADSLKKNVKKTRTVTSTTDLKEYTLDPDNPKKSIDYYYQVRSNVVHRGKAVRKDFDILRSALKELLPIFRELLEEAWKIDYV
jgi:hypothetical protein